MAKKYKLYNSSFSRLKDILFHPLSYLKSRKKENVSVLKDINFSLVSGECLGIVGRNGAGKSTLLGLLTGILKPTQGTIKVQGEVAAMLELGSGFHPDLSGRENIFLNAILHGLSKQAVNEKLQEIIEFSELEEFIDQPVRIYSSGMLARLGFSILIHLDADVLVVDEVLAVGDSQFQAKCRTAIEKMRERGVTIVLVSHNIADILSLCDKVVWVESGFVRMFGETDFVVNNYQTELSA